MPLLYYIRPGTGSYPAPSPSPTTQFVFGDRAFMFPEKIAFRSSIMRYSSECHLQNPLNLHANISITLNPISLIKLVTVRSYCDSLLACHLTFLTLHTNARVSNNRETDSPFRFRYPNHPLGTGLSSQSLHFSNGVYITRGSSSSNLTKRML